VIIEEMTYTGLQQVIEPFQPEILTVPTDLDTGIDVDAVESHLAAGARPAFIYSVTDGQNPLGVCLSAEKRIRLVELARKYNVPIVEDDAYGFLHYEESPPPPMRALDEDHVIYVGSFSKILAPGLRVGWLVAPESLMHNLSIIKEASDIDTCTLSQQSIAAFLEAGHLPRHLERLCDEYGRRRDVLIEALEENFLVGARWRKPSCGVFVWLELPEGFDTTRFLMTAVEKAQVAYVPGQAFSAGGKVRAANCMRLNFSNQEPERIREGISRLAAIFKWSAALA
jgi:2-aminoadipate transaminase